MTEKPTQSSESELETVDHSRVPIPAPGIGTRIEEVIKLIGSKVSAARASNVSPESLRRYVNELAMPPFDVMASLAETAGVNMHWLATGQGKKMLSWSDEVAEGSADYSASGPISPKIDLDVLEQTLEVAEKALDEVSPDARARAIIELVKAEQARRNKGRSEARDMLKKGPPGSD